MMKTTKLIPKISCLRMATPIADMEQSRSCGILFDIMLVYITRKGTRKGERA
jgi:hypothetical protein